MSKLDRNGLTENEIAARWDMFGPSPVLSSENEQGYYKLRKAFVCYFRPTDIRHWSWIRELVDTQWEIHGHMRARALAVKRYDPFWREHQYKTIFQQAQKAKKEIREFPAVSEYEILQTDLSGIASRIAMAERELQELAQPNDSKDRLAYENAAKHTTNGLRTPRRAVTLC